MTNQVERCELTPGFSISRVLTGLWQISDMERDGKSVDAEAASAEMEPYVDAGFTTFDMADHYGSAEEIAGQARNTRAGRGVSCAGGCSRRSAHPVSARVALPASRAVAYNRVGGTP